MRFSVLVYWFLVICLAMGLGVSPTLAQEESEGAPPMEFVSVPAGTFEMGSHRDSFPTFEFRPTDVEVSAFEIGKYEVTNARYAKCEAAGKCDPPRNTSSRNQISYYGNSKYNDYPVIYVDWNDAMAYCKWRGGVYRPRLSGKRQREAPIVGPIPGGAMTQAARC